MKKSTLATWLPVIGTLVLKSLQAQSLESNMCDVDGLRFRCRDNSTCISRRDKFCNGPKDCLDGSDEVEYNSTLHEGMGGTRCGKMTNGVKRMCYIPEDYVCDHEIDCFFGSDECNCSHTFHCVNPHPIAGFHMCRLRVQFCDNVPDCHDGSDETKYAPGAIGFQCAVTKTRLTNYCMLPEVHVCDGQADCDDRTDECFCNDIPQATQSTTFLNADCFRCLDKAIVVPVKLICDMKFHCSDLSDECLCPLNRPAICGQICGESDGCGLCAIGQVVCSPLNEHVRCINRSQVCDGKYDCPLKEDEHNCVVTNAVFNCTDGLEYVPSYMRFDNVTDCKDGSDETSENLLYQCNGYQNSRTIVGASDFSTPMYTEACDGVPDCEDLDDECNATLCAGRNDSNNTLPSYCAFVEGSHGFVCPNTKSQIIGTEVCDGFPTCNEVSPHQSQDEMDCPGRFYCVDHGQFGLPIHISLDNKCNLLTDCQDVSDELGCPNQTHFYCHSGSPKYISRFQVCNGVQDCQNGEDECQNCSTSPFSSDKFLINSYVLQIIVWITGLVACGGNLAALLYNIVHLRRSKYPVTSVVFINRILVINLNLADFLLGIYLLALGAANSTFENSYCRNDIHWRGSSSCSALGCLAMISIEASVLMLTVMTTNRLLVVTKSLVFIKTSKRLATMIAFAWIISILIAAIPLLPPIEDYFVSGLWYRNNPFLTTPSRQEVETFVSRLNTFQSRENLTFSGPNNHRTWQSMISDIAKLNSSLLPELRFGYYSADGVCLPRLFPDPSRDKAWGYSVFVMVINFCAFVYIASAYIVIYRYSTNISKKARGRNKANVSLQAKITRIVFTNFCCWIPICVMSFMSASGIKLLGEAYAISAIILLPINSAANPFLYSKLPDLIWKRIRGKRDHSRMSTRRASRPTLSGLLRTNKMRFLHHHHQIYNGGRVERGDGE